MMRCEKCGREIMDGAAFCPFCGERAVQDAPEGTGKLLYQAEVKRPLKPSGKLTVYEDRTEFATSSVQKAIFNYTGLVSVRKGLLDTIEFITEDGRTEACPADRKCVHEALVYIEQASQAYRARRQEELLARGIRYSFPSSQGLMNSGVLNLSEEQAEFLAKSGKSETVSYQDVKAVSASGGTLNLSLFGGGSKSFSVGRELLGEVCAFVSGAVAPYLARRKEALLAQGIYFSSEVPDGGTLDILAGEVRRKGRSGQVEDSVDFSAVREAGLYSGMLELALTDGTSRTFPVEDYLANDILAFVQEAIAPYVEARTAGFDVSFGLDERIEFNGRRGVFHLIRQGGKEITTEWPIEDLTRCELTEDKRLGALGSVVSGGIGILKSAAKGPQSGGAAEEKVGGVLVTLTIGPGQEGQCFYLGRSPVGMGRADKKYGQCMSEWDGLSGYLRDRCPGCALAAFILPEAGPQAAPAAPPAPAPAADLVRAEEPPVPDAPRRDDFGISGYIEGVSRFIETCATPMTIALQGNRGSGKNSVMGLLFQQMSDLRGRDLFWLNARQLARGESVEALSALAGKTLLGLLSGGSGGGASQAGNFLTGLAGLATGIIAGDTAIGKEIAGGVLNKNPAAAQSDPASLFSQRIEAKGENGKVLFFIDGLDQLSPARAVDLLEAMRDYFECRGCVFVVSADYRDILAGAQERYDPVKAKGFFDSMFKMTFRVPASSINVQSYAKGKLEDMGLGTEDGGELELYAGLILRSTGRDMEAMDRLFVSFQLLKDMTGGSICQDSRKRLTLFALLCMQARFRDAYDYVMAHRDSVTPAFLAELCGEREQPWSRDPAEAEAYRDFGAVLERVINWDGDEGISQEECRSFAGALELSSITSR